MDAKKSTLTATERMLVHLFTLPELPEGERYPIENTQQGIADVLGISRPYISKELGRLNAKGFIATFVARVAGTKRRMQVHVLTETGKEEAVWIACDFREILVRERKGDGGGGIGPDRFGGEIADRGSARSGPDFPSH